MHDISEIFSLLYFCLFIFPLVVEGVVVLVVVVEDDVVVNMSMIMLLQMLLLLLLNLASCLSLISPIKGDPVKGRTETSGPREV